MEDLRSRYGDLLLTIEGGEEKCEPTKIYNYPTLEQLAALKDEEFRALGFGYRAKFFVGMCELLKSTSSPLDPETLLPLGNPSPSIEDISTALQLVPGVGRKVRRSELRSDDLKVRFHQLLGCSAEISVCYVSAANSGAVSYTADTTSSTTRFTRCRSPTASRCSPWVRLPPTSYLSTRMCSRWRRGGR